MECHSRKSIPSLKRCDMKGIGGRRSSETPSPKKMGNKGHLASLYGVTNSCKKSYEASCKSITNLSLVHSRMVSDHNVDAIQHSEKSNRNGPAHAGSSRGTFLSISTR